MLLGKTFEIDRENLGQFNDPLSKSPGEATG
jgi:hypothetical protein